MLRHAVELVELHPRPTLLVMAFVYLADAELACGDRAAAQAAADPGPRDRRRRAGQPVRRCRGSTQAEIRIGRGAARAARRSGALVEELTDRELSVLRCHAGHREPARDRAALFLSINTVKAYNKSLYRKLGVGLAAGRRRRRPRSRPDLTVSVVVGERQDVVPEVPHSRVSTVRTAASSTHVSSTTVAAASRVIVAAVKRSSTAGSAGSESGPASTIRQCCVIGSRANVAGPHHRDTAASASACVGLSAAQAT